MKNISDIMAYETPECFVKTVSTGCLICASDVNVFIEDEGDVLW